ncbi:MAG: tetratricopeptide repeat protein [Burkholderiaceae bacterium]
MSRSSFAIVSMLLLATLASAGQAYAQTPLNPLTDDQVIERLSAVHRDPSLRATMRVRASRPAGLDARVRQARELFDQGRRFDDPRLVDRAFTLMSEPDMREHPIAARVRASIHAWRHEFDTARTLLERLLRDAPEADTVWFALAGIERVTGRLEPARRACERAHALRDDPVYALCMADINSLQGRDRAARRWLALAGDDVALDDDAAGWRLLTRARIAQSLGDEALASRLYRRSLLVNDPMVLTHFAHWSLDAGQNELAARAIRRLGPGDDAMLGDDLAVSLAIALDRTGRSEEAASMTRRLETRFATADQAGWPIHWRARARLALSLQRQADAALAHARRNWQAQREAIDARLLAHAALAAGGPGGRDALADLRAFVTDTGFNDRTLKDLLASGEAS